MYTASDIWNKPKLQKLKSSSSSRLISSTYVSSSKKKKKSCLYSVTGKKGWRSNKRFMLNYLLCGYSIIALYGECLSIGQYDRSWHLWFRPIRDGSTPRRRLQKQTTETKFKICSKKTLNYKLLLMKGIRTSNITRQIW